MPGALQQNQQNGMAGPVAGQGLMLGTDAAYAYMPVTGLAGTPNSQRMLHADQLLAGTTMPTAARKRKPGKALNTYFTNRVSRYGTVLGGR